MRRDLLCERCVVGMSICDLGLQLSCVSFVQRRVCVSAGAGIAPHTPGRIVGCV